MQSNPWSRACALAALLAGAPLAAQAQSSVTLYGIADAGVRYTTNEGTAASGSHRGSLTRMSGGGLSESRWGIRVREDLGSGTRATVNLENRLSLASGAASTPFFQQAWVGLESDRWGRVTMGRQFNVLVDLVASTFASHPQGPFFFAYKPEIGFSLGSRTNSALKYTLDAGPVRAGVQYSRSEGAAIGGATAGGYVRYAKDGLALGAGYMHYSFGSGKKIKAAALGGSYRSGPWYAAMGYTENRVDEGLSAVDQAVLTSVWSSINDGGFGGPGLQAANRRRMVMLGGGYRLTPALNLQAYYYRARQSGTTAIAKANAHFMSVAVTYALSRRTVLYAEADRTLLDGAVSLSSGLDNRPNGAQSRTGLTLGMRHQF
ncbi:MAG: porin [Pseudomonadota bacterium]|nr:porin [Pseudomonadota bacterium]